MSGWAGAIAGGIGQAFDISKDRKIAKEDHDMQMLFARHGIKMRVADATEAGIHPLAALGAQTMSYSPSRVGGGNQFERMGQNIGDAIDKMFINRKQKEMRLLQLKEQAAAVKNTELKNELLAQEVALGKSGKIVTDNTGVIAGQSDSIPQLATPTVGKSPGVEGGVNQMFQDVQYPDGSRKLLPSRNTQEAVSEGFHALEYGAETLWDRNLNIRDSVNPISHAAIRRRNVLRDQRRFLAKPKKGYYWTFVPTTSRWKEVRDTGGRKRFYYDKKFSMIPYGKELPGRVVKY